MSATRNCLGCKSCVFNGGWSGTDVTPGEPMEFLCVKRHWDLGICAMKNELTDSLDKALTCPDWDPEPGHEGDVGA